MPAPTIPSPRSAKSRSPSRSRASSARRIPRSGSPGSSAATKTARSPPPALDRHPHHRPRNAARHRSPAQEPARRLRSRHQLVEGARLMNRHSLFIALLSSVALSACSTFKPPFITYDDEDPKPAVFEGEPPKPVQVVEIPKPLPLPGQRSEERRVG